MITRIARLIESLSIWYKHPVGGNAAMKKEPRPVPGGYGKYPAADWFRSDLDPSTRFEITHRRPEMYRDEESRPPKPPEDSE
jgi:hypothetical protein